MARLHARLAVCLGAAALSLPGVALAARVTRGGGGVDTAGGGATFSYRVDFQGGAITGQLRYRPPGAAELRATTITSLARLDPEVLEIRGSGLQGGVARDFCAHVEDRADPGRGQDVFRIELDPAPAGLCGAGQGGLLTRGNLRILPAEPGEPTPASSQWACPDWGMYGRTFGRNFASDCPTPIDETNVATLTDVPPVGWVFASNEKTITASPAVVGGALYVGDWAGVMYALDTDDGSLLWSFQTDPAPGAAFGPIVSSAAVADVSIGGAVVRLVIFGAGPRLYALDASDGSVVWEHYGGAVDGGGVPVLVEDPIEFESSPLVWNDVVFIGVDPHNRPIASTGGVKGGLVALDARTGARLWKFEPDPTGQGCGGMWSSPVLDTKRARLYMATANCPTDYGAAWGPHIEAVTAVDAASGTPLWSFQPSPDNRDDFDFGATPNLFFDPVLGREVLGAGRKDAVYYALDPDTGALLWSSPTLADPGPVMQDFAIAGFLGSPATWLGNVFGGTALGGAPYFHSIAGDDGAIRWQDFASGPSYAASGTANGLVFHASLDNTLRAYSVDTLLGPPQPGLPPAQTPLLAAPLAGPGSSGPAVVGDTVYVGSGTSSSDACAKPSNDPLSEVFFQACLDAFDDAVGATGAIHAFRLPGAPQPAAGRLWNGQGNQLDVYDLSLPLPLRQVFIDSEANDPVLGYDLNAQICAFPDGRHILLGEDTGQSGGIPQGWGIFDTTTGREVGKLIADYGATPQPEQYGCAIETDGAGSVSRIFVSQVGGGNFEDADGQLIVFFASSPALDAVFGRRTAQQVCPATPLRPNGDCSALTQADSDWCILDDDVRTAGGIAQDGAGRVYLVEASPHIPPDPPTPGSVLRYTGPFPTSGGSCTPVAPEVFIQDPAAATPGAIVAARDENGNATGNWYVSSVIFPSAVNEYDANGLFVRNVVPPGHGTPFGLAVDSSGTLYYADIGIVFDPTGIPGNPSRFGFDTGPGEGSVVRVRFAAGVPLPPEVLQDGLEFPDGLGIAP